MNGMVTGILAYISNVDLFVSIKVKQRFKPIVIPASVTANAIRMLKGNYSGLIFSEIKEESSQTAIVFKR
jgi:hypothetical protein